MNPDWKGQYQRYKTYLLNMALQYRSRSDVRAYLEIILSLVTISVFAIFALRPTLVTIAELLTIIDSKEQTLEKIDQKIESLAQAESLFSSQRSSIELLTEGIPDSSNPDIFIKQIQGVASLHAVEVTSLTLDDIVILGKPIHSVESDNLTPLEGNPYTIRFDITMTGDYTDLMGFVFDLENLLRPVIIDSLTIENEEGENGENRLVLIISSRNPYYGIISLPNTTIQP